MGIDRIGPGGPPVPIPEAGATPQTTPASTGAPFRVAQPAETAASEAAGTSAAGAAQVGPSPLERLQAGAIDLERYADLKVDEATAHLSSLSPSQLASIRTNLREKLTTDPTLVDLVRSATGGALSADVPSDD
ncbi:MAG TPA: hypothetical protein VHV30_14345 [Polyangiaceae bacterium]|jgi:hypothetical protein|nr:hypothetical protein [Polyangiaceae bacterium]